MVQSVTGSQGYTFGGGYRWSVYVFGYPGDLFPSRAKVDSKQMRYCTGQTRPAAAEGRRAQQSAGCDMGHGASGGPWLYGLRLGRGWGYIIGDSSTATPGTSLLLSPHFGAAAANIYRKISRS